MQVMHMDRVVKGCPSGPSGQRSNTTKIPYCCLQYPLDPELAPSQINTIGTHAECFFFNLKNK